MKKLVLLEDAPWRAKNSLLALKEKGIIIEVILFFENWRNISETKDKLEELKSVLDTSICRISIADFYSVLDKYYKRDDIVMLFDLNLDDESIFEKRINVQYANSKDEKGKGKIWFYTTGGKDLKSMLVQNFTDQLIDIEKFEENQLYWDTQKILGIVQ